MTFGPRKSAYLCKCGAERSRQDTHCIPCRREVGYNRTLQRKFGMTREQYDERLAEQDGKCAICGKPSARRLQVDHDHATGAIRNLLCHRCNSGLGMFGDDTDLMLEAIAYIHRHRGV